MTEEPQPEASAAEVVVTGAEAEVPAVAEAEAEAEAEKKADEAAFTDDDKWEETRSFKEKSNLVDDLPCPQKKALDEFKQLIAAALAAGEFNLPPPLPQPKAEEEPRNEEPAKEDRKAKAEVAADAQEVKTEVPQSSSTRREKSLDHLKHPDFLLIDEFSILLHELGLARISESETIQRTWEEAKPSELGVQEKAVMVVAEEEIEQTFVSTPKSTSEEAAAPEAVAETQAAAPKPVLIWGVPLVGDDERTDTVLLKFLRAREFNVQEATAMLKSVVLWRERFGISSLLDDDLGLPELENVVFYHGADREGHPVCYNVYGEFQDKELYERAFGDDEKRKRFLKWRIQLLERGILSKLDFSPGGICSMVQVTDLKNSPPMLDKHRSVILQAVTLLQDNYPEFIAKKVFINVPWWYLAAYKMISPFLTQRTKSKFVFASPAKSAETLFRYIAPEQVPVQFGGLFKEDDPEFTTSDTVTELTIKPSSKETVEIPVTEISTIAWELLVLGWEVTYGAEFTPDTKGGYAVIVQNTRKVPANEEPIMKGSFKAGEPGKLVLTVNNLASKKKKLLYRSKTRLAPPRPPLLCSPAIRIAGEWEGSEKKETEEMNENDEDDIKETGEINDKGENKEDEKRGGQNFGQLSSRWYTDFFGPSRSARALWIGFIFGATTLVWCLDDQNRFCSRILLLSLLVLGICIMQYTIREMQFIMYKFREISGEEESKEETRGGYLQELSHQEHNNQMFGLSRFDVVWKLLLPPLGSIWELFQRLHARSIYPDGQGPLNEWVLDSGAWIHHTSKLELLLEGGDFKEMDNKDVSWSGDDTAAPHVQGRGSIRTKCFDFPGVHYIIGDDTRNVVSVSQLARDHGLVTVFEPTCCHVKDKKTGQIVGKGRLRNGMYMLDSLRIVVQCIGDRGTSGGDRHDGANGGGGGRGHKAQGNGEGDSTTEGRVGEGGTGARNQEEDSGSGAVGGDVNEINECEDSGKKEIEEMNENDEDDIKESGEINDKGENEEDEKRGQNFGQLSSRPYMGFFLSRFTCISLKYTRWGAGVTTLPMDFRSLAGFWVLFILGLQFLKNCMMQSTVCKLKLIGSLFRGTSGEGESKEKTWGGYLQELSHREHNKQIFGLSRFDMTTDPSGYQLPAGAFPSSTNAERRKEFLVDSGASFHATWRELILFSYPQYLQNHTKPPTRSFGGIVGSIKVTRSGYLNGDKIMIDGVLLAPESRMNLISVGQLSVQYGVQVIMDDVGVVIRKQQDGVQIGGGKMLDNHLYVLERFDPPGGLFAHLHTPHPKVFGRRCPGLAQKQ